MKKPIYTIGKSSISFSHESIKKRYSQKEDFIADVKKAHPDLKEESLDEVLKLVCDEVFAKDNGEKEDKKEEPKPSSKGKSKQEGAK